MSKRSIRNFLLLPFLIVATLWTAAALYFDSGKPALGGVLASIYLIAVIAGMWKSGVSRIAVGCWLAVTVGIAAWWFTLKPANDRDWQLGADQTAWAEINGDHAVIHNIRDFDYVSEKNFVPRWEERSVDMGAIRSADVFFNYWGSPLIAHIIVSYAFANGSYLATSIEARKAVGQEYSAIRGFFRQYEIQYLISEEKDVVRLRTNYRGESVYLYRTLSTPENARRLFLQYLQWANGVHDHPEWYNALTRNCITSYTKYLADARKGGVRHWDWRTVVDGHADEMFYDLGDLAGDIPFAELKRRALINSAAQQSSPNGDFSRAIRAGRPGFP